MEPPEICEMKKLFPVSLVLGGFSLLLKKENMIQRSWLDLSYNKNSVKIKLMMNPPAATVKV